MGWIMSVIARLRVEVERRHAVLVAWVEEDYVRALRAVDFLGSYLEGEVTVRLPLVERVVDLVDSCPHCGFVGVVCPEHERMGRVPVDRVVCRLPASELMVRGEEG